MPATSLRPLCLGALMLAVFTAGCDPTADQFPPVCPQLSLLKDAADVTRFAGSARSSGEASGHDARDLIFAARITAIPAHCSDAGDNKVRATLTVAARVQRGPAAASDTVTVPYFIALTEGERVLTERDFLLSATFRPNVDQTNAVGEDVDILLPVSKTKTAAAYHIYVGFRLTPEELAYNRKQTGQ